MPEAPSARTGKRVEVDVDTLRANAAAVVAHVGAGTQVMAMVKANGYGHGLGLAADAAIAGGAHRLGVVSGTDALALVGRRVPILVVNRAEAELLMDLVAAGVELTVFDTDFVRALADAAERAGIPARVHVKLDTGMGRLGVRAEDRRELLEHLDAHRDTLHVGGVFTHFADAEADDLTFTREQHARFVAALPEVLALSPDALVHCSNSGAILRCPDLHHDVVRLGIALYGYPPPLAGNALGLRPAMTMIAPVSQVKAVAPGDTVGYARTWTAERPSRVATIGAGYADGVLRAQSNTGTVLVHATRCPIIGRVSMDQITVDVTDVPGTVVPGEDAVLFGAQGDATLGADEVGAAVGTIPHEVICAVPDRIPRVAVRA